MNVVLLRVGIDTGCGGIHSPLFPDGSFEFISIPDRGGRDERTYGNTVGRSGRPLVEYFPDGRRQNVTTQSMHVDPEFRMFTYGDPTPPKRGLRRLQPRDLLVFYAGMEGWGWTQEPALYLAGYFEVERVGFAAEIGDEIVRREFADNFHLRHRSVYEEQRDRLLLVRGSLRSRLFTRAYRLGARLLRDDGTYWQMLSSEMAEVFGSFGGIGSIQRSTPRWVQEDKVHSAMTFVRSLT
jgi:Nucleotide modification associated domain 3